MRWLLRVLHSHTWVRLVSIKSSQIVRQLFRVFKLLRHHMVLTVAIGLPRVQYLTCAILKVLTRVPSVARPLVDEKIRRHRPILHEPAILKIISLLQILVRVHRVYISVVLVLFFLELVRHVALDIMCHQAQVVPLNGLVRDKVVCSRIIYP